MSDTTIIPGSQPGPTEPLSFLTPFAAATLPIGTPVYGVTPDSDTVDAAKADNLATSYLLGALYRPSTIGDRTLVQTRGALTMSEAEWNVLTGLTGGLTPGPYFLSKLTAGQIVSAVPTGAYASMYGYALNSITMILTPQPQFPIVQA
jgi:hypothetical protein